MPYLDNEERFYDYRTSEVTDKILFDTRTTGTSFYNDFIYEPEYMKNSKNLSGTIEYITPTEYFEACAKIFNSTLERQIHQTSVDKATYNHLLDVVLKYKRKFPMGFLNFAQNEQEGRHRMYVAGELVGWDTPQPVLIIDWFDKDKHEREVADKARQEAEDKLGRAVEATLRYEFDNIKDLQNQLQHEINNQYSVLYGEDDIPFELTTEDDKFVVTCNGAIDKFEYKQVNFSQSDDDLMNELSDEDEDISDWLKKILGESLEKHDTLNPKIWDGFELKPNIADAITRIVNKYIEDSEVLSAEDIIDIELLGSNANYNYTPDSDLDVHIIVNMESISCDPALAQIACNAEKTIFNKAYDIKIKGIDVELYVEDVRSGAMSNGIYSILKEQWIKLPKKVNIPDMTNNEEFTSLLKEWKNNAETAMQSNSWVEVQRFINELYNLRRLSLMTDGEFSIGNLVFKELRNLGLLDGLKDAAKRLQSKELSLEKLN